MRATQEVHLKIKVLIAIRKYWDTGFSLHAFWSKPVIKRPSLRLFGKNRYS